MGRGYFKMKKKYFYVIDMGSEYIVDIIATLSNLGYYCTVKDYRHPDVAEQFNNNFKGYDGLIISGSKRNVGEANYPNLPFVDLPDVPVLAICYGMQLIANKLGINIIPCNQPDGEKGNYPLEIINESLLWDEIDLEKDNMIHQYHDFKLDKTPEGWILTSKTKHTEIGSIEKDEKYYLLQWHPEKSKLGKKVIKNFVEKVC